MKTYIKYLLFFIIAINGSYLVNSELQFSFMWWIGIICLAYYGGTLFNKLIEYLDK